MAENEGRIPVLRLAGRVQGIVPTREIKVGSLTVVVPAGANEKLITEQITGKFAPLRTEFPAGFEPGK